MVASSVFKVAPKEYSNDWLVVRPGRARRPVFEGSKKLALDHARKTLQKDGGGVIQVLDVHDKVTEEMRISDSGEVVELRTYSPRLCEGSGVSADAASILLTAMDEYDELHRIYLVLGLEGNEVLAAIDGAEGPAALKHAGFDVGPPAISLSVDMAQLEDCQRKWGPSDLRDQAKC
jgi:hypothetical protein